MARRLGIRKRSLNLWMQGRTFPPKHCWGLLVTAGICTAAELAAWRPRRPQKYSLRCMRVYSLSEYAAK